MKSNTEVSVEDLSGAASERRTIRDHGPYRVEFGNAELKFRSAIIADPVVTGAQLFEAAGVRKPLEHVLFAVLANGLLESIRLDETVDLRARGAEKFLVFLSDKIFRLIVDDRPLEWGAGKISGAVIKQLAGVELDQYEVWKVNIGEQDELVEDEEFTDLTADGVERFALKRVTFKIIVNAEPHEFTRRRITYWEVVQLAFPGAVPNPDVGYTVDYDRGPHANPEGSMEAQQSVKVKNKMVFYVAVSDKS